MKREMKCSSMRLWPGALLLTLNWWVLAQASAKFIEEDDFVLIEPSHESDLCFEDEAHVFSNLPENFFASDPSVIYQKEENSQVELKKIGFSVYLRALHDRSLAVVEADLKSQNKDEIAALLRNQLGLLQKNKEEFLQWYKSSANLSKKIRDKEAALISSERLAKLCKNTKKRNIKLVESSVQHNLKLKTDICQLQQRLYELSFIKLFGGSGAKELADFLPALDKTRSANDVVSLLKKQPKQFWNDRERVLWLRGCGDILSDEEWKNIAYDFFLSFLKVTCKGYPLIFTLILPQKAADLFFNRFDNCEFVLLPKRLSEEDYTGNVIFLPQLGLQIYKTPVLLPEPYMHIGVNGDLSSEDDFFAQGLCVIQFIRINVAA